MSNLNLIGATLFPPHLLLHTLGSFKPKLGWYKEIIQNWIRITALFIIDCTTFIITEHQFLHYQNKDITHLAELFWAQTHKLSAAPTTNYTELPNFKHNNPFSVYDYFISFQSNSFDISSILQERRLKLAQSPEYGSASVNVKILFWRVSDVVKVTHLV